MVRSGGTVRVGVLAAVLALVVGGGAVASTQSGGGSRAEVTVCVGAKTKALRLVSNKTTRCGKGERLVSWNTRGRPGVDGADGADGASAYEVAVALGFTGTTQEWLVSLQGADGADGATGPTGATGATGAEGPAGEDGTDGADGEDGAPGVAGQNGAQGVPGPPGATGPQGPRGLQGEQGPQGIQGPQGPAGPTELVAGAVNPDGTLQASSSAYTVTYEPPGSDHLGSHLYTLRFDASRFSRVPVVVVTPLGSATVAGLSQSGNSTSGWTAKVYLTDAAVFDFIATRLTS